MSTSFSDILQYLIGPSLVGLVCLVAIVLILSRGNQLPVTAVIGFGLLLLMSVIGPVCYLIILPGMLSGSAVNHDKVSMWYFLVNTGIQLFYAMGLGFLLHAILKLGKQRWEDLPGRSAD